MLLSSLCCYSRQQMHSSRLRQINSLEGLKFVLLDAGSPVTNVWRVSNPKFEQNALTGRLDRASVDLGVQIASVHSNADQQANKDLVLIYLSPVAAKSLPDTLSARLEYKDITRIEVFEPDAGKTIGLALGIAGGLALIGLVALVIACNCPHVYAEGPDGASQLEGSLYSGAIYPQLERADWLPMRQLQPVGNQYQLRLVNQESQHQHTNLLALEVLDHAPGLQPVFDQYGQLHTLASPQTLLTATNVSGQDVRHEILAADEKIFLGDLDNQHPDATERLTLTFAKPARARQAKLLLNAKNSDWLDYTYFEFQNALGQYADEVARKYRRLPAAENLAWTERQKIPLAVWLETVPGQWEKVDYFHLPGASAFRQAVLPLDLTRVPGDVVRLRLEFGFHFWEIDYVALDSSLDQPVQQTTLRPVSAITQTGADQTVALTDDDDHYYEQPGIGDEARIVFEAPPLLPGYERSLVLRAKGHYEILFSPAPGRPGLSRLKAWDKEYALPRLSRERWRQTAHIR